MSDDDHPHQTESVFTTFRSFLNRVIEEMPARVIAAITFVAFFFCYGGAINLIKLAGIELASIDFPVGVTAGAIGAAAALIYMLAIQAAARRRERRGP